MIEEELVEKFKDYNIFIGNIIRAPKVKKRSKGRKGSLLYEEALLSGFLVAVKDNINVRGFCTSAGTKALQEYKPTTDAPVVAKIKEAGAIVIGKTNLHELGLGVTSKNYLFGPVRNPADLTLFAGGSSGGTAASIAAGFVKVGLGSDTGGSIRIPASLCGVYGYRPTTNRYPSEGLVPISNTRDTIGILANNLEDIELFDSIITTGDDGRSNSPGCYGTLYRYGNKIRIGVSKFYFFLSISKGVNSAVDSVIKKLSTKSNIELVNADMIGLERLVKKEFSIVQHELNVELPKFLDEYKTGVSFQDLIDGITSPDVERLVREAKEKFDSGETEEAYKEALEERTELKDFYETFFDKHRLDAILYPTTPIEAKSTEDCEPSILMDGKRVNTLKTLTQNTLPGSYAGIPSISMPLAKTSAGLPVGIQVEVLENQDRLLFEIAGVVRDAVLDENPTNDEQNDKDGKEDKNDKGNEELLL